MKLKNGTKRLNSNQKNPLKLVESSGLNAFPSLRFHRFGALPVLVGQRSRAFAHGQQSGERQEAMQIIRTDLRTGPTGRIFSHLHEIVLNFLLQFGRYLAVDGAHVVQVAAKLFLQAFVQAE